MCFNDAAVAAGAWMCPCEKVVWGSAGSFSDLSTNIEKWLDDCRRIADIKKCWDKRAPRCITLSDCLEVLAIFFSSYASHKPDNKPEISCKSPDYIVVPREYFMTSSLKPVIIQRVFPLCLCAEGKVYAMGGMGVDTTPQAMVRVYEAEKDQWQPLTSMPTPRYGATPFVRGNKIYLMGRKRDPVISFPSFHVSMFNSLTMSVSVPAVPRLF